MNFDRHNPVGHTEILSSWRLQKECHQKWITEKATCDIAWIKIEKAGFAGVRPSHRGRSHSTRCRAFRCVGSRATRQEVRRQEADSVEVQRACICWHKVTIHSILIYACSAEPQGWHFCRMILHCLNQAIQNYCFILRSCTGTFFMFGLISAHQRTTFVHFCRRISSLSLHPPVGICWHRMHWNWMSWLLAWERSCQALMWDCDQTCDYLKMDMQRRWYFILSLYLPRSSVICTAHSPPEVSWVIIWLNARQEGYDVWNWSTHVKAQHQQHHHLSSKEAFASAGRIVFPLLFVFQQFSVLQANAEKDRLEEKQRNIRHERVAQGLPACTARWFEQIAARNAEELPRWRYRGGYWEARESGKWASVPDIYGENQSETQSTSFSHKAAVMLTWRGWEYYRKPLMSFLPLSWWLCFRIQNTSSHKHAWIDICWEAS